MKPKKFRLWTRSMALVLSFMLLLPSIALAKDSDVSDSALKTEIVQVDLDAEIEKALQESGNFEDGMAIAAGGNEKTASENDSLEIENADLPEEISTRRVGVDYPATELYIIGTQGTVGNSPKSELINCGKGVHISSDASAETKYTYDRNGSVTITIQSYGCHLASHKTTVSDDIYWTGSSPYDYVIGQYGGIKDYKMDYLLVPGDKEVDQTTFEISYFAYMSDGVHTYPERTYRTLVVNWGDPSAVRPAPDTLMYSPIENYLIGLDDTMEFSLDGKKWDAIPSGVNALYLYNALDYQRGLVLYVRYKATDTAPASEELECNIPGLTRPAPRVSLTYDLDAGKFMFSNLTPGQMYDISMDAFNSPFYYFTAPASGNMPLVDAYAETGNIVYMRLRSTNTEGPSAKAVLIVPEKDGYGVEPVSAETDVAEADLYMIESDKEVFVEEMGDGIIAINYDGEIDENDANIISGSELASEVAE